jgi:hypothetical protein
LNKGRKKDMRNMKTFITVRSIFAVVTVVAAFLVPAGLAAWIFWNDGWKLTLFGLATLGLSVVVYGAVKGIIEEEGEGESK